MAVVSLRNSVVVVTGASSGIGRATAAAFAEQGSKLVLAARRKEALEELAEACRRRGVSAMPVPTDVTDEQAVQDLAHAAVDHFGRIDVWVNNAGVTLFARVEEAPMDAFRRVMDTNLFGYLHGARAVLPVFREQGSGVLINNGAVLSAVSQPYTGAYVLSKHAIRALSAVLRQELALEGASGIRVCTVMPATIDTPLFQHAGNFTGRGVQPMPPVYPPEKVARVMVNMVRWPRREAYVGGAGRIEAYQARIMPGLSEWMMASMADRLHLDPARRAPASAGNLFNPVTEGAEASGGWGSGWGMTLLRSAEITTSVGIAAMTAVPRAAASAVALLQRRLT